MFCDSNLSIVISGPILGTEKDKKSYTRQACNSARSTFPNAEIILSTWEGEDVSSLNFDKCIYNSDPGPNINENTNRQICSRRSGIQNASREYVLSIRSDSVIKNTNFLSYIDRFTSNSGKFKFVLNRIVIPATYPASRGELFHIGDWYFFGHKADVLNLWDIPYMDDKQYNQFPNDIFFNPHRYLITEFVKKYYKLKFRKITDINEENKKIYENVIAENFVVTGFYEFGIISLKYPLSGSFFSKLFHKEVSYSFNEWKYLYNKYSKGNENISFSFYEFFLLKVCVPIKRSRLGNLFMKVRSKIFNLHYWE